MKEFLHNIKQKVWDELFDDQLEIRYRLMNIILLIASVCGFVSTIASVIGGVSLMGVLSAFSMMALMFVCFVISIFWGKHELVAIILCVFGVMIIFPIMYFTSGADQSGMLIWMGVGLLFVWLTLKGKAFYIIMPLSSIEYAAVLLFGFYHPQYITPLATPHDVLMDMILSLLLTAIVLGSIFKYNTYLYEKNTKSLLKKEQERLEAIEELELANKAKSDFLANMSHEIRTPINAVVGMDEMILRECKDEEIKHYAEDIQNASHTLLSIINDILDFSKIESGKMEIIPVEYDLSSLIVDCYNMVYMRATDKNLAYKVTNDPQIPKILYGDEIRIRQIVTNLLTNAVKYTPHGSVALHVGYRKEDDQSIVLIISVSDTGVGISEANQKLLFEAFKRIEEKKNRSIEGTGLGLAITKQLLGLMNGSISIQSKENEGSVFTVEIPQQIVRNIPIGDYRSSAQQTEVTNLYHESFHAPDARILMVDDVNMNLKVTKALLKKTAIIVDCALSGPEALEMVAKEHYDVILLDHMMPKMDGIETLQHMMETQHLNNDTPVIALTANAIVGAREMYLAAGFRDYLSKPVKGEDLEKMLRKYLPSSKYELLSGSKE